MLPRKHARMLISGSAADRRGTIDGTMSGPSIRNRSASSPHTSTACSMCGYISAPIAAADTSP